MYTSAAFALFAVLGKASAHMIMKTPAPFGNPDNSPLSSSGANFPCKLTGDPASFYTGVTATEMAIGTDQTLSFTGSAVHGGGSCQLAITSDLAPTAASQWQVILSIEGGCPSTDGNGPSEYKFQIPDSVAPADYVFAWIWISKLAGQPEYYMNCAPIKVTGGPAKRAELAIASRAELPGLFVANMGELNDCKTEPGTDPQFPNPGPNVSQPGNKNNFKAVTGNCIAPGTSEGGSGGSGGSGDTKPPSPSNGAPGPVPSDAAPSAGGGSGSAPVVTQAPVVSTPTPDAPVATPPASGIFLPPVSGTNSSMPSGFVTSSKAIAAPSETGSPGSPGGAGALSGACTDEGMFNCPDGANYQQCASGMWTTLKVMPTGTKCTLGTSTALWARGEMREGRFRRRMLLDV